MLLHEKFINFNIMHVVELNKKHCQPNKWSVMQIAF